MLRLRAVLCLCAVLWSCVVWMELESDEPLSEYSEELWWNGSMEDSATAGHMVMPGNGEEEFAVLGRTGGMF